ARGTQGPRHRHQESLLRRQDLSAVFRRPGETPMRSGRLSRVRCPFWAALLCACFPSLAPAQLDPELDNPYRLQVVLHVADNRFLTPIFQEQLQGSLRAHLELGLGPLAKVEVVVA